MNLNLREVRQQRFEHFKKQALLALTTAFRAPLMLMMGCGYVSIAKSFMGQPAEIHDHDGTEMVHIEFDEVPYNEVIHGKKIGWVEEGKVIPGASSGKHGTRRIHRHSGNDGTRGPYEYRYE